MNRLDENMAIGTIVSAQPLAARVFFRRGLDFCCGGGRSLRAACAERSVDPNELLTELRELGESAVDFRVTEQTGAGELIDHIVVRFHDQLKQEMPTLSFLMDRVGRVHGERHAHLSALAKAVDSFVVEMEPHMAKEERVLFPMIRAYAEEATTDSVGMSHCGSVLNPLRQMEFEHESVARVLEEIRTITADFTPPADACNSYRSLYATLKKVAYDTYLHVHMENNVLHPLAARLEGRAEGQAT